MSTFLNYDTWSGQMKQYALMASAAELHGLIAGMLCSGVPSEFNTILPVLQDFINDGQAFQSQLKANMESMFAETYRQIKDEDFVFQLLLPSDDDAMTERLEALVEWAQAFLVGFAIQQTDLSLVSPSVREAIDQLTEVTKIDAFTADDTSAEENEVSYYLVLEHVRMMVFTCYHEVGKKFPKEPVQGKTLH